MGTQRFRMKADKAVVSINCEHLTNTKDTIIVLKNPEDYKGRTKEYAAHMVHAYVLRADRKYNADITFQCDVWIGV